MSLVSGSIARPVTVAMATVAIVLFGGISLDRLGLNLLPELTYPTLTIRTEFDGAAPAEVEEQVTRRIEQRVGVVSGVRKMHSISTAGRSDVILEFLWGTDMDLAAIDVREKLDLVQLPLEIERPSLLRLNPNLDPIYRMALTRADPLKDPVADLQSLRRFADEYIKRRLEPVPGVAAVIVSGGYEDEISVLVDQDKLAQLGIDVAALGEKLKNTNVNLSGGRLTDGSQEYLVRTLNQYQTVDDIRDTIIFQKGGRILRLKDIATVVEGQKERDSIMRVDGREAIEISLYKEGDSNTVEVAGNVRKAIDDMRKDMPPNFRLVPIYDQSTFISAAIREVQSAAIQGAFLAVLVLYLFLRDLRSTLIVTATIPASVMATFAMMRVFDITLNVMSLGGIALAVGMLMDNAIVVLENVARHKAEGKGPVEAADLGASEVGGAVVASTLTTIAVFLPLAFVEGIAGQLFRDQALTVTFALVASLLLAFTLIPMLLTIGAQRSPPLPDAPVARGGAFRSALRGVFVEGPRMLLVTAIRAGRGVTFVLTTITRPVLDGFDAGYAFVASRYERLLRLALVHRVVTLASALIVFAGSLALLPLLAVELIPPLSQGEFKVDFELSPGTRLEFTDTLLKDVQDELQDTSLVGLTYSVAGTGGKLDASAVSGGENIGELNVVMADPADPSQEQGAMKIVRAHLEDVPDLQYTLDRPQLFTLSTPLEVEVSGTNLDDIRSVSDRLVALMAQSDTFRDVESSMRAGYPEIQIEFDQERTAALGLTVPAVAQKVVQKVKGDVPTEFTWQDKKIDIRLRVDEQQRDSVEDIENLVINLESGAKVPLSSIATVHLGLGPSDIQRIGQQRVALISANVPNGDLGAAAAEVREMIRAIPHPAGIKSTVGGQNEEMEASFRSLQFALLLALIMVYLVMASLFESLLHPFVIMFTIPLAGVGAILALAVTGTSVSVVVFIGLILLVGIVVNNAIVLIDRVNGLREAGVAKHEALVQGASQRLRPIMMTTLTTVLGLAPMAIGLGEAAELRTPMAITVIGGLVVSTLLTLVVIPVVYDVIDRKVMTGDTAGEAAPGNRDVKIAQHAIRRPVTVVMSFIGLAMIGLFAAFRLPIEQFPEVEIPFVGIGIPYANSTAQEVERNVARPVEEVLSTMSGIDNMVTYSRPGHLFVNLSLDFNRDVTGKGIEAKELIEGIRHRLPEDIRYIQLRQEDPNSTPVMNLMISDSDIDPDDMYEVLDTEVRAELERIPGVNSVSLFGVDKYYVRIAVDPGRMEAYGVDYLDISRRLQAENFFASAGTIDTSRQEFNVRPLGQYGSLDDIRRLPINDRGLILDDVADIELEPEKDPERRRVNGQRAVGVSIFKRPEANLIEVTRDIEHAVDKLKKEDLFSSADFKSLGSQADTIVKSLNDLRDSGLIGGLLSVITLFIFLRQAVPSLLIAGTVPLALCATLGVMYFMDMSLNILSVVGLMLGIGLLVDNSVVVAEAIALRRQDKGTSAAEAADKGVSEVGLAIMAGTLTTVIVFVPSFMTEQQQVAIIQQNIALPLCTSLLGSLLVAQTLVPTLMARLPLGKTPPEHRFMDWLASHYTRAIRVILNHRLISFVVSVMIAASGVIAYRNLDVNMNPEEESPRLVFNYYIRGSLDIDTIESVVDRIDGFLLANKEKFEIDTIFSSYDTDRCRTVINLKEDGKLSPKTVEAMIMKDVPQVPNVRLRFSSHGRGPGGRGGESALGLRIIGDSTEELIKISDTLVGILEREPALTNVQSDVESSRQELRITLKPELASQVGVTASMVSQSVAIALGGRQMRRDYVGDGKETDITLELQDKDNADLATLRRLPVFLASGDTVPLEAVADISVKQALRSIRRENRETSININFSMRRGPPAVGKAIVEGVMKKYELPPGYRWTFGREFDRDAETFREMAINFALAVALVYMLMAALFESILFPTTVLIAIGYSVVGVFWFLFLAGTTLTAMALTGMLLLAGIVVNNGIVLLDRIIQLRRQGADRITAIVESGRHRLRPILLTVCTTVAGMLPLAVGDVRVGGLGPSYFPMARAIIGGLTFSTLITLLVLPLIYVLLDDLKNATRRFWQETRRKAGAGPAIS